MWAAASRNSPLKTQGRAMSTIFQKIIDKEIPADIVYEVMVENFVTRFNAVFHSELPAVSFCLPSTSLGRCAGHSLWKC